MTERQTYQQLKNENKKLRIELENIYAQRNFFIFTTIVFVIDYLL